MCIFRKKKKKTREKALETYKSGSYTGPAIYYFLPSFFPFPDFSFFFPSEIFASQNTNSMRDPVLNFTQANQNSHSFNFYQR